MTGTTDAARRCPVCGRRFVPGHPRRRDAIYDRPACRTAAWRARRRELATRAVTGSRNGSPDAML